jgi:hypothetical protein
MTTELLTPVQTPVQLIRSEFRKQNAIIEDIKERYAGLTVENNGFKVVKAARIEVKNLRCSVENLRKDLKSDVIERGKIIDEEAARLKALLVPIEKALEAEEEAEEARKASEARAKIEAEERILQGRIDVLARLGIVPNIYAVKAMSDDQWADYWTEQQTIVDRQRIEAEAAAAEAARIAAEAEHLRLAQIEADRIERERLAALHAEEMRRQAEELAARERELSEQRKQIEEQQAAAESARLEALRIEQAARDKAEAERQAVIAAERAKLDADRAELARQQAEARKIQAEREAEEARLEAIRRKRIQDEEEVENLRQWNEEQEAMAAAEKARIEALLPEIEMAESLQVYLGQTLSLWLERHGNRAWFGYAESEISSAALRIVEHVRKS